jgi:TolA-binding protein
MKTKAQVLAFSGLLAMILFGSTVYAAETQVQVPDSNGIVRETQTNSVFKGALYQVWGRLRTLSPQAGNQDANSRVIVTAGIRGAESTDTALKPYWKDDRSNDADYLQQLQAYNAAQELIDKGQMKEAAANLNKFIDAYPGSELMPNAMFAEAMALAGMGQKSDSIKQFNKFIKENPKHPLRADAELAIKELSGGAQVSTD